jgi:diguanylate cyclase (GGDEF)-like protein
MWPASSSRSTDSRSARLAWWWRGGEAVGYGRLVWVGSVGTPALGWSVLGGGRVDASLLAWIGVAHVVAAALSFLLPWRHWPAWALLAFPVFSMASVALTTTAVPGVAGVYGGFFALCFAYAGLFLPARGSYVLLLPAVLSYLGTLSALSAAAFVRVAFLVIAWLVLGELLGLLRRRHDQVLRQLRVENETDALTGLANRRGMERFLAQAQGGDVVVVFDLDHFKQLNDAHGHGEGDRALRTFGRLLQRELRTRDRAARSGGEEMAVLLRCSVEDRCGVQLTRRLRAELERAYPGLTFSAGIAVLDADLAVETALDAADHAMYRAKAGGRDQVWLSDAGTPGGARPVADFRTPAGDLLAV